MQSPLIEPDKLVRLAFDGAPDLQTVVSPDGVYRFASVAGAASFGWTPRDLVGRPQASFTHPDDQELVRETHKGLLAGGSAAAMSTVHRFRCKDGTYRWTESRSRVDECGSERMVVSAARDIADRMDTEVNLQRQAATDPLTGVANRTVFMDRLRQALHRLGRHEGPVAVLFLDLDRFKLINDSLGHQVGDAVLLQLAERLLLVLRPQDTLARLGGDEFAIVAEDLSSPEDAIVLGNRIIEAGRRPFLVGEEQFVCTTSAGIAVTSDAEHSAEGLLQEADLALYRAKGRGRDRVDIYDEDLRTRAIGRLSNERMLRRAIDEDRLRVNYQPIIDLISGNTVSAEALVRIWDPQRRELILAESFIHVAEETRLLCSVDDWVLKQVIHQAATWREKFPNWAVEIAINVTARHLAEARFAESVIDDTIARGLPPEAIQIEVTERVLMEASNSAMKGLNILRAAGVKVGLDDFGTGYSSLSYLRMFPLDFVKIDLSFVQGLTVGDNEAAIVASIVELGHALGMTVVAEGVETREQFECLVSCGCDRAQGFYFDGAGPPELVEQRVRDTTSAGGTVEDLSVHDSACSDVGSAF